MNQYIHYDSGVRRNGHCFGKDWSEHRYLQLRPKIFALLT